MAISASEFQAALRAYPAGVTIVTSVNAQNEAMGATVSAFMGLSKDPPLVLISLNRGSRTAAAIVAHKAFVVNFVNEATAHLAQRFANGAIDKFAGVRSGRANNGAPILLDCEVRLSCSLHAQHEGGDHLIFVGHVDEADIPPVLTQSVAWYGRRFHQLVALPEKA